MNDTPNDTPDDTHRKNTKKRRRNPPVPPEVKKRVLELAGNPHNGTVDWLYSQPDSYRVLVRVYKYNPVTKRGDDNKLALGVVIGGKYYTTEEYQAKYTRRGNLRASVAAPKKPKAKSRPKTNAKGQSEASLPPSGPMLPPSADTRPKSDPGTAVTTATPKKEGTRRAAQPTETVAGKAPDDGASRKTYTQTNPCLLQRNLGALPILYQTAINCGLLEDLREAYGNITTARQILSIALHWLMDENNVAQRYPDFSSAFALPFLSRLEENQLASFFSLLSVNRGALTRLFELRMKRLPSKACVSYDSTSIPTTARDVYYAQPSLSKDGIIESMQHFSLLVDQTSHQPLMYRLYSGTTPDCRTVEGLCHYLKELGAGRDLLAIFDRGYETLENLLHLSLLNCRCLMAVRDLKQADFAEAIQSCSAGIWDASNSVPGFPGVHGRTVKIEARFGDRVLPLWVHVFLSLDKAAREEADFMRQLDEYELRWHAALKSDAELLKLKAEPWLKYYKWPGAYGKALVRDPDAINAHTHHMGFFADVSNCELSSEQALTAYRHRDCIEKCFKAGKTKIKLNTARAHRTDTMEGRFVVAFVALTIISALNFQLAKERPAEGHRKTIHAHAYNLRGLVNKLQAVTVTYGTKTQDMWLEGVPKKEIERICRACGTEDAYTAPPDYIQEDPISLYRH